MSLEPMTDDELEQARFETLSNLSEEDWDELVKRTNNAIESWRSEGMRTQKTFRSYQRVLQACSSDEDPKERSNRVITALRNLRMEERIEDLSGSSTTLTFEHVLTAAGIGLSSKLYTDESRKASSDHVQAMTMSTGQP